MSGLRLQHAVWGAREWRAAIVPRRDAAETLEARAAEIVGAPAFALNAARVGLQLALSVFAEERRARRVLVPAYICPAVAQAVRAAGLVPHFVKVGPDLNLDPAALSTALGAKDVLAVVAARMYAYPFDSRITALCRAADVLLIDDAAHAPLARDERALADISLTSFAQSKTLSTGVRGSGGLLVVHDRRWLAPLAARVRDLPTARHRVRALAHFATDYLAGGAMARVAYYAARLHPLDCDWYQPARIGPRDAAIALAQLDRSAQIVAERRRRISWYAAELAGSDAELPQVAPGRYLSRLMVRTRHVELRAHLQAAGIATRPGYSEVVGTLLELPLDVTMCAASVARVCHSVRAACEKNHDASCPAVA